MTIREEVIIVQNGDGDIVAIVSPDDPLNPEFSVDEIMQVPDLNCTITPVSTMRQHRQYAKDNAAS